MMDMFKRSITMMVDHVRSPDAPFSVESLIIHLSDEASRLYSASQELRFHAAQSSPGLAQDVMNADSATLKDYAEHCLGEIARLIPLHPKARENGGYLMDAELLPYVAPTEEL